MAKSLIFLATGYEDVEMLTVVDMLRRAGTTINMVSITGELEVTSSHNVVIKADELFENADIDSADMLILPGGLLGTQNLLSFKPLTDKLEEFNSAGKFLAAVCAAPSILGTLGILKGRHATCYPGFEEKLIGAIYQKKPVVRDGNIITSRGMGTCIDFSGEIITVLDSAQKAEEIKAKIIYNDTY
ncbi:MAG TPA: DJ-1 family protein [Lachnospiraceae bacterium]|nr:DJ-1 family protein [Lachnospiraceae bacterium]